MFPCFYSDNVSKPHFFHNVTSINIFSWDIAIKWGQCLHETKFMHLYDLSIETQPLLPEPYCLLAHQGCWDQGWCMRYGSEMVK